jgi:hypothetical protein
MEIDGLSEKQKMLRGKLYNATDRDLVLERQPAESQLALLNGSDDPEQRVALLRGLLGAMGEETVVRSPFFCDYGYNIYLGRGVFLNFNCVLLDVMPIRIGDKHRLALPCRSTLPTIRAAARSGWLGWRVVSPSRLAETSGSAEGRFCYLQLTLAMMRSSALAAW